MELHTATNASLQGAPAQYVITANNHGLGESAAGENEPTGQKTSGIEPLDNQPSHEQANSIDERAAPCQEEFVDLLYELHAEYLEDYLLVSTDQDLAELEAFVAESTTDECFSQDPVALLSLASMSRYADNLLHGLWSEQHDLAIERYTQVASSSRMNGDVRLGALVSLVDLYSRRFRLKGEPSDLVQAKDFRSRMAPYLEAPAYIYNHLANLHFSLCRNKDLPSLLDRGLEYMSKAVSLTPDEDPTKLIRLDKLGEAYHARYEFSGNRSDLDKAIKCHVLTVPRMPDTHPQKLQRLQKLSSAYRNRYRHLGQLADLDAAINVYRKALFLIPDGHSEKLACLGNLGLAYSQRFEHLGQISDCDSAIELFNQAILEHGCDSCRSSRLSDLGSACLARFEALGQLADLDTGFAAHQQALMTLNPQASQYDRARALNLLSNGYYFRYGHSADPLNLDLAIHYYVEALSLLPEDDDDRPTVSLNLGVAYGARYTHLRKPEDLDLAIDCLHAATKGDKMWLRTQTLKTLGELLSDRFDRSRNETDILQSLDCFKQAAQSSIGDPKVKSIAAHEWARIAVVYVPDRSFLEAYEHFMSLIPDVVWLGLSTKARYEKVSRISYVTVEAAIGASTIDELELALEWLEQGRSIVWNQLLQLRSPLDRLQEIDPSLAQELADVAHRLQNLTSLKSLTAAASNYQQDDHSLERSAQLHRRLAERWTQLLGCAQALPGMSEFLTPMKASKLVESAREGAVVVVMIHRLFGGHAIIIPPGEAPLDYLSLEDLSYADLASAYCQLNHAHLGKSRMERKFVTATKRPVGKEFTGLLAMLWDKLAKPVLDLLGYTENLPADQLPRITWCTTGILSFLPLHAAGDYSRPNCALFDFAVCSYTPTLSALLVQPPAPATFSGIAMVGQESTPGLPQLSETRNELDKIVEQANHVHISTTQLDGEKATSNAVIDAMEQRSWIHLACHASQNYASPAASAFHLHDGPLDLATITRKHFKHADLAFLSACQTATGDMALSEEAVHLAAGMIMAGYRAVIATMWAIEDQDAPLVAERFYEYMLRDGVPDSRKSSRALHYAVTGLREKVGASAYRRWAPYIHMGN
ncbi:hypothetical protein FRC12_012436 [Ceratobasidium sp. 428]|nr:hypothetical protein FRC12_012436 [Ceratobasidium sp. 428]